MSQVRITLLPCIIVLLIGCGQDHDHSTVTLHSPASWSLILTSPVYAEFAEAIVPEKCEVQVTSCNDGEPSDEEIRQLQQATLIVRTDADAFLDTISIPTSRVLNIDRVVRGRMLTRADTVLHQHGPAGDRSATQRVSGVWLDPSLLSDQITVLSDRIQSSFSAGQKMGASRFTGRIEKLKRSLGELAGLYQESAASIQFGDEAVLYLVRQLGVPTDHNDSLSGGDVLVTAGDSVKKVQIDLCRVPNDATFLSRMEDNVRALKWALDQR